MLADMLVPIATAPMVGERDHVPAVAEGARGGPFECRQVRLARAVEPVMAAAAKIVDQQNRVLGAS